MGYNRGCSEAVFYAEVIPKLPLSPHPPCLLLMDL
jgi:hypothetical protein